jgi:hypothetical protein
MSTGYEHSFIPPLGFIPDEKTAITIAEAVLLPIYGEEKIKQERPFTAILNNGTWQVSGSLANGYKGGVAIVEISQKNGQIFSISHGK